MLRRRSLLAAGAALGPGGCAAASGPAATPFALPALPGPLRPLGGLRLDNRAIGFGGLSGLHLGDDLLLAAVSDRGFWLTARLELAGGAPAGLATLRSGRLRDGSGRAMAHTHAGDAESLARLPDGSWLVGFERWHRIRAFRTLDAAGTHVEAPPGLELATHNGGLEPLTVLADGRWLAIAEALPAPEATGTYRAWIGGPGRWRTRAYRPAPGFVATDAAALPDGGALVLERHFSLFGGFTCRLVRLAGAALAGDGVLEGALLLDLTGPLPADNWEGVGVAQVGGRLLVALVSDDNETLLQQSMLLLFDYAGFAAP